MATTWVGAAIRRMLSPWAPGEVVVFDGMTGDGPATRLRGQRTPDGVASWLTFHGVRLERRDASTADAWRSI